VPVSGEGADLQSLFADLAEDLLAQIREYGPSLSDVALDGMVRRNDGGYRAWGYAYTAGGTTIFPGDLPAIVEVAVNEDTQGVKVRATVRRH
jgi:hypothetical protein